MQKLFATFAAALSVFVFSCSDNNNPTPPPDPPVDTLPTDTTAQSASMLTKSVLTSGSDVTTMMYQYDAQKRLMWYSNTSTKAGYFEDTSRIVRDAGGMISQIIYRSDTSKKYNDPLLDSVVYNVFSNGGKYTDKVSKYSLFFNKFHMRDSSHYTYSGDRIVKEEAYYWDSSAKNKVPVYKPAATNDFTYDQAGNLTRLNTIYYKVDSVNDYSFNVVYTYDDKGKNLLNLGNEAVILGLQQNFSGKALKTFVSTYPEAAYNRSFTYKYLFNKNYLPLSAELTDAANGNAKSTLAFTYQ